MFLQADEQTPIVVIVWCGTKTRNRIPNRKLDLNQLKNTTAISKISPSTLVHFTASGRGGGEGERLEEVGGARPSQAHLLLRSVPRNPRAQRRLRPVASHRPCAPQRVAINVTAGPFSVSTVLDSARPMAHRLYISTRFTVSLITSYSPSRF